MKRATWLGVSLAVCIALCLLPGTAAYAWFNDVTDSYPASQDVPTSGDVLTGADVPEGVYSITATTSSSMCKLSNVTLTSAGGGLWATFTMSGAYNALYPGTAEEAAALTNEDGTDVSAYYVTDPLEGYVSRQFSIPIDALNEQMTLATYSGGSKGIDGGMWYTRTVVFNSSSEVDDAIAGGGDDQDQGGDGDSGDDSGDGGGSYDPSGSDSADEQGGDVPDDGAASEGGDSEGGSDNGGDSQGGAEDDETSEGESNSSATPKTTSSNAGGNLDDTDENAGEEGSNDEGNRSDESASSEAAATEEKSEEEQAQGSGARMREIKFAGNQVVELGEGDEPDIRQQEIARDNAQKAGVVAAGALGAINVALIGAYVFGLRRARPKLFTEVADKISRLRRK